MRCMLTGNSPGIDIGSTLGAGYEGHRMSTQVSGSGSAVVPLSRQSRIPLWVKALFTGFPFVLVPYYWHDYGPTNFLYFCDVALFMALAWIPTGPLGTNVFGS